MFGVFVWERMGIVGHNRSGKSTMIKICTGELKPIRGKHQYSDNCTINYYAQDLKWTDPELSPLEIANNAYTDLKEKKIRKQLSRCGISREHAGQHIKNQSGGKRPNVFLVFQSIGKISAPSSR
jgi:ATPase subunit of ABC transporter with duplicated ATPase domains